MTNPGEKRHTAGPWEIFTIASSLGRSYRIYAPAFEDKTDAVDIAHIPLDWDGEANARLIAAAPDMYEALKLAAEHHQGAHSDVGNAIREALSRAVPEGGRE